MSLTNQQFDTIEKEYEHIRRANRDLMSIRRREIEEKIPAIVQLEAQVSTYSADAIRAMLDGDMSLKEQLPERLAELQKHKETCLTTAGYPADYLEPIYTCAACRDTGYVEDANHFKTKCACLKNREIRILYSQSRIQELLDRENFTTLSDKYYQGEDLKRFHIAVKGSKDFVQNFKHDYRNLIFYGTVGTGKSFLSGCIAKELLDRGHSCIYYSASSLFDSIAHLSFNHKERDAMSVLSEDLYSCDLLIIDDLGTELTNAFVASALFSLINERSLRQKPIIISTNLRLDEIRDRYTDRIYSRIVSSFDLYKLTGADIRILKRC